MRENANQLRLNQLLAEINSEKIKETARIEGKLPKEYENILPTTEDIESRLNLDMIL